MSVSRETGLKKEGQPVIATTIYQRTDAGRIEIQSKKQGLTQSERLILIVVDGRTPLVELGEKLKGLENGRIRRAIERLLTMHLIFEVLMLGASVKADMVDSGVIDRFLQQDPLDPVTIVSFDADYEYEESVFGNDSARKEASNDQNDLVRFKAEGQVLSSCVQDSGLVAAGDTFIGVDFYIPLVKKELGGNNSATISADNGVFRIFSNIFASPKRDWMRVPPRVHIVQLVWRLFLSVGLALVFLSIAEQISRYFSFT